MPVTTITPAAEPGLFYPKVMMGQRDFQIFPLYGQYTFKGALAGPIFPTNSVPLLAAGFGKDGGQGAQTLGFGVAANPYPGSGGTTTSGAITAGQVAHGDGQQISYTSTVLTDTNAVFTSAIVGSIIETFGGKTGTVTAQTGTTLTVASWTGGTPVAGESYNVGPTALVLVAAGGFIANDIIQIDVNAGGVTSAEIRKITAGAGSTSLTLDRGLWYAHASGVNVRKVGNGTAPIASTVWQHFFVPGNQLDSLTVEKNLGQYQSEQFTGMRVGKYALKAEAKNTEVGFTGDLEGAGVTVLTTPTALSVVNELPFVYAEGTIAAFGAGVTAEVESITIDIENGVKPTYTFNQAHTPAFVTPVSRKASGTMQLVFTSLNDAAKGYFVGSGVTGGTLITGAIDATFTHPGTAGTFQMHLNQCRIAKITDDIKVDDIIHVTLGFEAEFSLSSTPQSLGYASVGNVSKYAPY